mgnify:FL=1|tara:strand:- start:170 stop:508 length:339 start_codon:yes stop_codon:yes gene_type:complete
MPHPSATLHVSEKGTVTVLAASLDAGECLEKYRDCDKSGKVYFLRRGHLDKDKKVESKEEIAAKAREIEESKKARAAGVLKQAESAAKAADEAAKKAKAKVDSLKPAKAPKK